MRQTFLVALAVGLVFSAGCGERKPPDAELPTVAAPRAAVRLTLLVVDDPEIAAAAKLLRGEWAERSGGELVVEDMSSAELGDAQELAADLIIYPSRQIGTLVARDWLRTVRDSVLQGDTFAFDDLLPLLRNQVMRYGGQIYAVSLGEAPLVLAWNDAGDSPPDTWKRLDEHLPSEGDDMELTAELIARAASYLDPRYRAELLFDPESLAPRLTSPSMMRALEEIVARSKSMKPESKRSRITWPTSTALSGDQAWRFAALPKSEQAFDVLRQEWEPQPRGVPLPALGFAGRSASVTATSRNATSAFKLLAWLTTGDAAAELSSRSHATVWFRNSQSMRAERWLHGRGGDEGAMLITRMLSGDECFLLPRVPGIDRYLAALREAVGQAVRGELPPVEALEAATQKWNELTDHLGRDQQKLAYRRHLGLVAIGE